MSFKDKDTKTSKKTVIKKTENKKKSVKPKNNMIKRFNLKGGNDFSKCYNDCFKELKQMILNEKTANFESIMESKMPFSSFQINDLLRIAIYYKDLKTIKSILKLANKQYVVDKNTDKVIIYSSTFDLILKNPKILMTFIDGVQVLNVDFNFVASKILENEYDKHIEILHLVLDKWDLSDIVKSKIKRRIIEIKHKKEHTKSKWTSILKKIKKDDNITTKKVLKSAPMSLPQSP